jgi:hypothetical protein
VIRLGLRLTLAGGREAVARLVIIGTAVALGVGLLLAAVAGIHGVGAKNARESWLNSGIPSNAAGTGTALWWLVREDYYDGRIIARVDVAALRPDAPVPPGLPRLPGPGEYYASPEMSALLRTAPADQLGARYPGHPAGTVGPAALPAPNSLVIVVGSAPDWLAKQPGARRIDHYMTLSPDRCDGCVVGYNANAIDLILGIVAGALLFPVLIFIGTASRLAAARREERFAAMRLVGATPRQVAALATVESTVAALAGTAVGFALFFAVRGRLAAVPFTGEPFFPADLSLRALDVLLVALGVPVAAAVAARIALRRVQVSPLGVTRRVTPRPPRWYRLIPLVAGVADLFWFLHRRPRDADGQLAAYLSGFVLIMVGLVLAGPWLTMVGSRLMVRLSRRPAVLIAARRLADNPKAGFRAVSGLILALYVTSAAVAVITAIVAHEGRHTGTGVLESTVSVSFFDDTRPPVPGAVPDRVRALPGVKSVTVIYHNPFRRDGAWPDGGTVTGSFGLAPCADLARAADFGHCPPGAQVAGVEPGLTPWRQTPSAATVLPAADMSLDELYRQPMLSVVVGTDGAPGTIERVRTALELGYPLRYPPSTQNDDATDKTTLLVEYQQLADVVVLTTLPIAGCSLAVGIAGGLSERKRPFSLLRLAGVPLRVLRRVVALESAVPLLAVAVLAIGAGWLAADLFLRSQMRYPVHAPDPGYYLAVGAGLLASFGLILSMLPLLRRLTGPEAARNE